MQEAVEGEAVITDVDEETLEEVLHYIYTGKLSGKNFSINSLFYAVKKYQLDINTLKDLIPEEIRKTELKAEELAEVFISCGMFEKEDLFTVAMEKLRKNKEMMDDFRFEEMLTNAKRPELLFKIMKTISISE